MGVDSPLSPPWPFFPICPISFVFSLCSEVPDFSQRKGCTPAPCDGRTAPPTFDDFLCISFRYSKEVLCFFLDALYPPSPFQTPSVRLLGEPTSLQPLSFFFSSPLFYLHQQFGTPHPSCCVFLVSPNLLGTDSPPPKLP